MARMIGKSSTNGGGCGHGKSCTCNNYYRAVSFKRSAKRRERQDWKREVGAI